MNKDRELSFEVAVSADGSFTAFSTAEPVFCFVRETEEAAVEVAIDSVKSYFRHFKDEDISIDLQRHEPIPTVRIQRQSSYTYDPMPAQAIA